MEWQKGEAIWRQIERQLVTDIKDGLFQPGEQMPTEKLLAERFDVNRHTVRRAISALTESDILRVEQGRGTFVQEPVLDYPLGRRTRFSQIVSSRKRMPDRDLLKYEVIKADKKVARSLDIPVGEPVIRMETVSVAEDTPLAHGICYLPEKRFRGIEDLVRKTKSLTEAFKYFGIQDYTRKQTRITAQIPATRIANLLRQAKNKPIILTEAVDVDESGKPIEFGVTSFASERVQLMVGEG